MVKQHMAIADCNDVVMKHAAIDSLRRLLGKHRVARIQLMQAGHRFAGLEVCRAGYFTGAIPPLARRP